MAALRRLILLAAVALCAAARAAAAPPPAGPDDALAVALRGITEDKLRAVVERLSTGGPRLSGYPRNLELAEWLEGHFRRIGLADVDTLPFYVTVPVQKFASLEAPGEREPIPLHAVWPNLVRTSTVPGGKITGKLLYVGDGHLHRFNGRDVRGSIVLLDFNSGGRWENAALLGAAACLFVGTEGLATGEVRAKYHDAPLAMPRFWIGGEAGKRLAVRFEKDGPFDVTLRARQDWERRLTKNVYGFVRGTGPEIGDELIVVEAYYDSVSVIPSLAPGATQACGLAAMLAMAEHFAAHPPQRSMMFLATSGHAQALAGVREFFDTFNTKLDDLNERAADTEQEIERLDLLREALLPLDVLRKRRGQAAEAVRALLPSDLVPSFDATLEKPRSEVATLARALESVGLTEALGDRGLEMTLGAAVAEAQRLDRLVDRLEETGDPSQAFGAGEGVRKRNPFLMTVAALGVAVLLALASLLGRNQGAATAGVALGALAVAFLALAALTEGRSELLTGAAIGFGVVLPLLVLLLGVGERLRVLTELAVVLCGAFIIHALVESEAIWALWVILAAPVVLLTVLSLLLRNAPRLRRARNIATFLCMMLALLLESMAWGGSLAVPAGALPAAGLLCGMVLLARVVDAAAARRAVVVAMLSFVGLFLAGMTPSRKEVEADKLRGKMLRRLHDPMGLAAEECAKQLFRLRSLSASSRQPLGSKDAQKIEALDELRLRYKRLSWREGGYAKLTADEKELYLPMLERTRQEMERRTTWWREKLDVLRAKVRLAYRLVQHKTEKLKAERDKGIYLFVGLELSSKTDQVGAFERGWLYQLATLRHVTDTYSPLATRLLIHANELEARYDFRRGELRRAAGLAAVHREGRIYTEVIRGRRGRPWRTYVPHLPFSSEVASLCGEPGISFATLNDERHRLDSPADTIEHVEFANLATQTRFVLAMLDSAAADRELVKLVEFPGRFGRVTGRLNMELSGLHTADQPVPGALVTLYRGRWEYLTGARRRIAHITGPDGEFEFVGTACRPRAWWRGMAVEGYRFDPQSGEIVMAINDALVRKYPNRFNNSDLDRKVRPVLFDCEAVTLYNLFDQRYLQQLFGLRVLDARREAEPVRYGTSKWWTSGVIFLEPLTPMKVVMAHRLRGVRLLLLNASEEEPEGIGYTVEELRKERLVPLLVARDFMYLVGHRLKVLEERGIRNQRLRELHEEAVRFYGEATQALAAKQYDVAVDSARSAWAYESRAYPDVQATIHDTVAGALLYVALLLPFAYCIERLFFSYARITSRAAATIGILAAAIIILWHIHPAFELATNPFVVVLAFFLLTLSGLTLTIIMARFEDEMKKLERARSGIEVADVSRASAFGAAFALGIANMRRRKVRTALTAATLVILTFAIMSFTSIRTRPVEMEQAMDAAPSYKGVLIRRRVWARMDSLVYSMLYDKYGQKGIVTPRYWRGPQKQGERSYIDLESVAPAPSPARAGAEARRAPPRAAAPYRRRKFTVKSLLGLSPNEERLIHGKQMLLAGRWFEREDAMEVILPRRVAQSLGVRQSDVAKAQGGRRKAEPNGGRDDEPGGEGNGKRHEPDVAPDRKSQIANRKSAPKVRLFGIEFTVVGLIDSEKLEEFLDLNGEPITPVDWSVEQEAAAQESEAQATQESEEGMDSRELQYVHVPADQIAILPSRTLATLGGSLRSIAVAFPQGVSIEDVRRHLKDRLTLTLYLGDEKGVYKFTAADVPSFQGLRNIVVPLIIAFLIVLNTMLGSVHERIREVGIYSSVGLAPGHISMLFMAEALGLAVVSSVFGYLLSQAVVKVLFTAGWMDTQHMFLNYSSSSTVGAILMVILMVLASTAYPARMVSRVASPDIERRWSLPPTVGNQLVLRLPYSLSHHDVPGLLVFLHRFIRAHEETSFGVFCVRDVELEAHDAPAAGARPGDGPARHAPGTARDDREGESPPSALRLSFSAWLAPYDLGVYQKVAVTTEPADEEGFDIATVAINRESGELAAWRRNNLTFLNQIRKQLLIWRAIGPRGREKYVAEAKEAFD